MTPTGSRMLHSTPRPTLSLARSSHSTTGVCVCACVCVSQLAGVVSCFSHQFMHWWLTFDCRCGAQLAGLVCTACRGSGTARVMACALCAAHALGKHACIQIPSFCCGATQSQLPHQPENSRGCDFGCLQAASNSNINPMQCYRAHVCVQIGGGGW